MPLNDRQLNRLSTVFRGLSSVHWESLRRFDFDIAKLTVEGFIKITVTPRWATGNFFCPTAKLISAWTAQKLDVPPHTPSIKKTMKAKPRITSITISRLFNLGNYEHVKYDLCVQIPEGASVKRTFLRTVNILKALAPIQSGSADDAKRILRMNKDELAKTRYGESDLRLFRKTVAEHERRVLQRQKALEAFDELGGTSKFTDAKLNWDTDSDY